MSQATFAQIDNTTLSSVFGRASIAGMERDEVRVSSRGPRRYAKRVLDLALTIPGLILLSPLLLLAALWVRLDSTGPVLFRQQRVGRDGKLFTIFKFRSMTMGADKRGLKITAGSDARVTRSGRFLRASKIDELPQLFNVILGEMSLVGPRPEVPEYVRLYPAHMRRKVLAVSPGITDIASIFYRDESGVLNSVDDPEILYIEEILPRKLAYASHYARANSIGLDIKIILATFWAIVFGNAPSWLLRMPDIDHSDDRRSQTATVVPMRRNEKPRLSGEMMKKAA